MTEKQCIACSETKPKKEFGRSNRYKDGLQRKCRQCIADYQRNYRQQRALAIYEYLQEHPCIDCGESDPIVLDFDHVRGQKRADVSRLVAGHRGLATIMTEIEKCEVRCANCHRRKTAYQFGYMKLAFQVSPVEEWETWEEPNFDQLYYHRSEYIRVRHMPL